MVKEKAMIGGQAVMNGVMMRSPNYYSVAVRSDKGKIIVKREKIKGSKNKFLKLPFVRGIKALIDNLVIGTRALIYSADAGFDKKEEKISTKEIVITLLLSAVLAVGIFVLLPLFLARVFTGLLHYQSGLLFNIIDGVLRIIIFIIYIYLISLMKDVKILFQYHGAEHKSVNCYEHGKKLEIKNIMKYSTEHKRCGTSFLIIVLIISIFVFSVITSDNFLIKLASRIVLIPVIAGVSYEILKLSAKYEHNLFFRILSAPGLWVQKVTTGEPDKKQIEVALAALKDVMKAEKIKEQV